MLHEVPDQTVFLKEIKNLLKPDGKALVVEPRFHVSKKEFQASLNLAKRLGFDISERPDVSFSQAAVIKN